ncbi:alpha-galactosidase [Puniceicoccus vermicola]|uniref:Alpha-galactosidase n=1 Tax=Puniceicoccus vermicola TaxID=388746 RepID=A0A7X1E4K6_9BACT|nr:alpha-galactosidase [Puniceicoccus vermicola]MBC2602645.1 alpha-galactosidase [Puniceicoccus vermicola]
MKEERTRGIASWGGGKLTLGNDCFEESWSLVSDGFLQPTALRRVDGPEWSGKEESTTSSDSLWKAEFRCERQCLHPCAIEAFVVTLRLESRVDSRHWRIFRFQVYPGLAGSILEVFGPGVEESLEKYGQGISSMEVREADGVEIRPNGRLDVSLPDEILPPLVLKQRHCTLRQIEFVDQTDHHADFVCEREWMMHPSEKALPLRTNVICLEQNRAENAGEGILWVLLAPLRHVREPWSPPYDFLISFEVESLKVRALGLGYPMARLTYRGGRVGAAFELQKLQRVLHEWDPSRDGLIVSNTWGDRAAASHLNEAFLRREIEAARALGVEVVQIDDGWQKGETVNTVKDPQAGVWNGFWAADPDFWKPHPERFPDGLRPVVDAAEAAELELGLWFAPDSSSDFQNWEKDAEVLLALWRELGVRHFKLDAVKLRSRLAEQRFHQLCDYVLACSQGKVLFDFDATAERRPTYWGRLSGGPMFLENRYTDFGNYYPHQTLRALWDLTRYGFLPSRLRLEFLNSDRNEDRYPSDDPLAPKHWPASYQLATVLPTSPLAWFEMSEITAARRDEWGQLLACWKPHRIAFQRGEILAIGERPNGFSWCGFLSYDLKSEGAPLYAFVFRELAQNEEFEFDLPSVWRLAPRALGAVEQIAGNAQVSVSSAERIRIKLPEQRDFSILRWSIEKRKELYE